MPRHFLLSTLDLQPRLTKHRREVEEIASALTPKPRGAHTNPEVFAQITHLSERARTGRHLEPGLEALRLQAGMVAPGAAELDDGPYRLQHVDGFCYRAERGCLVPLPASVVAEIDGYPGCVLLPFSGLFADLLEPSLYPPAESSYDRDGLLAKLAYAFSLLVQSVPDLGEDLWAVVRTTILTPRLGAGQGWSYNLRLAYFGGIFLDPFAVGPHGIAESLLHEYCHQRLWQWWAYEPPSGLPPPSATIRSPMTGRDKPALVMVHALLIYVAAHAFHRACLHQGRWVKEDELSWMKARENHLRQSVPLLYQALCTQVASETTVRRLLEHVMAAFAEAAATPGMP
jgi:hypothetical protein